MANQKNNKDVIERITCTGKIKNIKKTKETAYLWGKTRGQVLSNQGRMMQIIRRSRKIKIKEAFKFEKFLASNQSHISSIKPFVIHWNPIPIRLEICSRLYKACKASIKIEWSL